jgi:menaquinol-cytochrome c reductase iron-sulfur subunit
MNDHSDNRNKTKCTAGRRTFLKGAIAALGALIALVTGLPFLRTLFPPARSGKTEWNSVTGVNSLPIGRPVNLNFSSISQDAYIRGTHVHSLWVIKHSPNNTTVFSPVCTHLGCYYTWDSKLSRFECPCHGSVFSINGTVLSGPAPRPLDTLPHKIEKGVLYVKWEEFKPGVPRKIRV